MLNLDTSPSGRVRVMKYWRSQFHMFDAETEIAGEIDQFYDCE